jgi:serine/threonine protein kinase
MEYYPKGDLYSYLSQHGPLSELYAQDIISQVFQGLAIMHEAGFAHRDIKPQVGIQRQEQSTTCLII